MPVEDFVPVEELVPEEQLGAIEEAVPAEERVTEEAELVSEEAEAWEDLELEVDEATQMNVVTSALEASGLGPSCLDIKYVLQQLASADAVEIVRVVNAYKQFHVIPPCCSFLRCASRRLPACLRSDRCPA